MDPSCHTVAVRRRSFYPLNYGGGKREILGGGVAVAGNAEAC